MQRATALGRRSIIHRAPTSRTFAATAAPRQAAAGDATTATKDGDEAAASGRSSCIAGTVLTGLNYFKGKADPVALPDNEYPEWLWSCIDVQKKAASDDDPDAGDLFSKSKKQRRIAAKRQRVLEAQVLASGNIEALAPKIPLQQQSINLPDSPEQAFEAVDKREELRTAMRKERKAKIKEANYLKSM